jgi:predicted naringenin-chalcone synthase
MRTELIGFGTALPDGSLTQDEAVGAAVRLSGLDPLAEGSRKAQILNALYRRSGVSKRHSVVLRGGTEDPFERQTFYKSATDDGDLGPTTYERMQRFETAAPILAQASCEQALVDARVTAAEIRHLVTVSCSGFAAPGFDLALYPALGLAANVSRTNVGFMGCHGALNGLRVARALSLAHAGEPVLLCATELCSLHHQYTEDPQQIVANSLFADGSAAVVLRSSDSANGAAPSPHSAHGGWTLLGNSSCLLSESSEMMSWKVGNHGFQMTLSAQVPEVIRKQLKPWLENWLATQQLTLQDISSWAVHPGGPRILTATTDALKLDKSHLAVSAGVLAECGNMSSPTILFILDRLRREGLRGPCVAIAFGPGLVVEAALLRR